MDAVKNETPLDVLSRAACMLEHNTPYSEDPGWFNWMVVLAVDNSPLPFYLEYLSHVVFGFSVCCSITWHLHQSYLPMEYVGAWLWIWRGAQPRQKFWYRIFLYVCIKCLLVESWGLLLFLWQSCAPFFKTLNDFNCYKFQCQWFGPVIFNLWK